MWNNCFFFFFSDGNFVIKMFTFFECDTVCLLYLLAASFTDVNVIKPATSKEGNSEVYVVCTKFRGRDSIEPHLSVLQQIGEYLGLAFSDHHLDYPLAHASKSFFLPPFFFNFSDLETFQKYSMFPSSDFNKLVSSPKERLCTLGGVPKIFLRQLIRVAQCFADIQVGFW